MKNRTYIFIIKFLQYGLKKNSVILCFLYTFVQFTSCSQIIFKNNIIALINEDSLYLEEFKGAMDQNKASLYQYFTIDKKVPEGKGIWTFSIDGTTPGDSLKVVALNRSIKYKVEWQYLKKQELVKYSDYYKLLEQMHETNNLREEKLFRGEVIYGPQQYSEEMYFLYLKSNAVLRLKDQQIKKWIDLATVHTYYQKNKDSLFHNPNTVTLSWTTVKANINSIRKLELSNKKTGHFLEFVKNKYCSTIKSHTFSPKRARTDETIYNDLFPLVFSSDLEQGKVLIQAYGYNKTRLVYVDEVKDNGYRPLTEVEHVIKNRLFENMYKIKIDSLVKIANVILNKEAIENITKY